MQVPRPARRRWRWRAARSQLRAAEVNLGSTLSGTGTTSGVTVNAGGTLAPGTSGAGTLTVNGNLSLAASSNYTVGFNGSGNSTTAASGSAIWRNIHRCNVQCGCPLAVHILQHDRILVLTAASISGTTKFSGITVTGSFGDQVPYLIYTANKVEMQLTAGNLWTGGTNNWNTGANWIGGVPTGISIPATSVAAFNTRNEQSHQCQRADDGRHYAVLQHGGCIWLQCQQHAGAERHRHRRQFITCAAIYRRQRRRAAIYERHTAGDAAITVNSGGTTTFSEQQQQRHCAVQQ